ncbi:MAG: hypothetical protein M1828_001379 [Chrysothrix sp. TS-e1954]|nr:MAG: hypothetical protein M1828_001379 [Chrysothrix sp. TS-e1954]
MAAKTIRWGILSTGGIAQTFTRDLLVDPKTRGVDSIVHTVAAAASSSGKARAEAFLKDMKAPSSAKAYGSYEEFVKDPDVDIVYVATPHSHHYQNAMLCLQAGKPVLCEKAFTTNAAQTKRLVQVAKEKNLFLMEAVWTRYFPLSIYCRELVTSGRLGDVTRVFADNSNSDYPEDKYPDDKHRMINPELAGGALLDLGIYSLTWVFQILYHTQPAESRKRPSVSSSIQPYRTGADEMTTMLLTFPRAGKGAAHGVASTGIRTASNTDGKNSNGPSVRIVGDKGELQIFAPIYRPTKARLVLSDGTIDEKDWFPPGPGKGSGWHNGFGNGQDPEGEGHGMFWEADEAAMALVEGRKEGKYLGYDESILIMEIMDEVRIQNNMKYPEKIETLDFPVAL